MTALCQKEWRLARSGDKAASTARPCWKEGPQPQKPPVPAVSYHAEVMPHIFPLSAGLVFRKNGINIPTMEEGGNFGAPPSTGGDLFTRPALPALPALPFYCSSANSAARFRPGGGAHISRAVRSCGGVAPPQPQVRTRPETDLRKLQIRFPYAIIRSRSPNKGPTTDLLPTTDP
ncbi:Hypothetical protein NTJ_03144 [Nesidiocoris tenuis]|uniref:Uncharacterized protein n=1 Tax=Nesidiocoris tenuis TaxID=355587 RepID=A0ABN7ADH4_9HEMI|nr:Hypothetical protein NTJ_03144 [Nesidiocoris tenuis]